MFTWENFLFSSQMSLEIEMCSVDVHHSVDKAADVAVIPSKCDSDQNTASQTDEHKNLDDNDDNKVHEVDAKEYYMFLCWKNRIIEKIQRLNIQESQHMQFEQNKKLEMVENRYSNTNIEKNNKNSKPISPALLVPPPLNLPYSNVNGIPYPPTQQPENMYNSLQNSYQVYQSPFTGIQPKCACGLPLIMPYNYQYLPMQAYMPW